MHPHTDSVINSERTPSMVTSEPFLPLVPTYIVLLSPIIDHVTWSQEILRSVLVSQRDRAKKRCGEGD